MKNRIYAGRSQLLRPSGNGAVRTEEEGRSAFRKDYARLLHAPSFRRLQGKTQLFPGTQSDYFRNRLTHSLEVAQIARGIASKLNSGAIKKAFGSAWIDEDLVEFAAIAHDLGHPPFGHNGEQALDALMRNFGGFEGNAQTLRILANVERKLVASPSGRVTSDHGLDLTYRSLASVLKYDQCIPLVRPQSDKLRKGYYESESGLVKEIKRRVAPKLPKSAPFKTIECAIMDIADDIAYSTYDLEDSLHAGFYTPLSLAHELASNQSVNTNVLTKTNSALIAEKYEPVKDVGELLDVVASVFGVSMPASVASLRHGESKHSTRDALAIGIESFTFNQSLSDDGLFRTKLTAERVGRLISAVELRANSDFPQLSSVRLKRRELLQVEVMKHLNYELVIRSPRLAVVEHRGKDIVNGLFDAMTRSKGALLPMDWRRRYDSLKEQEKPRAICDFIACMTDRYAFELYGRLFGEDSSIYKPL